MFLCYIRVSTAEQANDAATSLPEQERKTRAVAELRGAGGFDIQVYREAGVSGSTPLSLRPAGSDLLDAAKPGDTIIATKLDRLFRSTLDALQMMEQFKAREIHVILVDFGIEPIASSPIAKLFFQILASFADFERERINERTLDGRKAKRVRGGYVGGQPPLGFRVVGEGREAHVEPLAEEQEKIQVIKETWRRFTPAAAVKELERLGVRDRAGSPLRITQAKRIAEREHVAQ